MSDVSNKGTTVIIGGGRIFVDIDEKTEANIKAVAADAVEALKREMIAEAKKAQSDEA